MGRKPTLKGGETAARAFDLFDKKPDPAEAMRQLGLSTRVARDLYDDWEENDVARRSFPRCDKIESDHREAFEKKRREHQQRLDDIEARRDRQEALIDAKHDAREAREAAKLEKEHAARKKTWEEQSRESTERLERAKESLAASRTRYLRTIQRTYPALFHCLASLGEDGDT